MPYIRRDLASRLTAAARSFPAIVLTGPRRSGKIFFLRKVFGRASHHLLEDPDVLARVRADLRCWLEEVSTPAVLDEVQNAPETLPFVRTPIDRAPGRMGRWLLTGSHDVSLMKGVSDSMPGRAAVFHAGRPRDASAGRVRGGSRRLR